MEELLLRIAENTLPKKSMSIAASNDKTKFVTRFNPPIELDDNKCYEMAMVNLETYYSFPNIDSKRNHFKYSTNDEINWFEFELPVGCYTIRDINDAIRRKIKENDHDEDAITIEANSITLKAILKIATGYRVDFTGKNSIRKALGFNALIYINPYNESENVVDILSVNTILVNADIISGSYVNGAATAAIYSFFPNVDPGHKIVERPRNLVYLPVHVRAIANIETTSTDQNDKRLNLRGERISIRYHLREI